MTLSATLWIVAGVAIGLLEMVFSGFYLLGFAIGAVATGALIWAGLIASLPVALLSLGVIALMAWAALRRALGVRRGQKKIWTRDINDDQD